ncbi:MAG: hypothetical protein IJZ74_00510 [Clostridia bacterium]|nr:hypothetical protein [Clostridia bacterium]
MGARGYSGRRRRFCAQSSDDSILVLIGLLFFGTLFTFGMQYWNESVDRSEAIPMTALYQTHEVCYSVGRNGRRGSVRYVQLTFSDSEERLEIDGCCVTEDLMARLNAVSQGAGTSLLIHPNSDTVLEMIAEGQTVLSFEEAQRRLRAEATGFGVFGSILYAGAAYVGARLLIGKIKAGKTS